MRVMVIVKANKDSEAAACLGREILEKMGKYNEELTKAGVMLAGEGLHSSARGARVRFSGKGAHSDRRALRGDQGAGCRLLALEGEVPGGSHRVAETRTV